MMRKKRKKKKKRDRKQVEERMFLLDFDFYEHMIRDGTKRGESGAIQHKPGGHPH